MPTVPEDMFNKAINRVTSLNLEYVPPYGTGCPPPPPASQPSSPAHRRPRALPGRRPADSLCSPPPPPLLLLLPLPLPLPLLARRCTVHPALHLRHRTVARARAGPGVQVPRHGKHTHTRTHGPHSLMPRSARFGPFSSVFQRTDRSGTNM